MTDEKESINELNEESSENVSEDSIDNLANTTPENAINENSNDEGSKNKKIYKIASGKSLSTLKGILSSGEIVDEKCFANKKQLKRFLKAGYIEVAK